MAHEQLALPDTIVGPAELARLCRELETFDEEQQSASLRARGTTKASAAPSSAGAQLSALAAANDCDLSVANQRSDLIKQITNLLKVAPTITMSFAVDPSSAFMAKIVAWFRQSVHPQVLIRVGLQPDIAAGFMLRTPGKVYDFSLRGKFTAQRSQLIQRLKTPVATATIKAPTVEAPHE